MKKFIVIFFLPLLFLLIFLLFPSFSQEIKLIINSPTGRVYYPLTRIEGWLGYSSFPLGNHSVQILIFSNQTIFLTNVTTNSSGYFYLPLKNLTVGNYSLNVSVDFNGTIISNLTIFEIIYPNFNLSSKKISYSSNENVTLDVIGPANTYFELLIFSENYSQVFPLVTYPNGTYHFSHTFPPGNYSAKILDSIVSFIVNETPLPTFQIILPKKTFLSNETIEFKVVGSPNTTFELYISNSNLALLLNSSTNKNGEMNFSFSFNQSGNYNISVYYQTKKVSEETFEVIVPPKPLTFPSISTLELIQKEIVIGLPVEWEKKVLINNTANETFLISLSTFNLPPDAFEVVIKDENDSVIFNNSIFSFQLLPFEERIFKIQYLTPPVFKSEREIVLVGEWRKEIILNTSSSTPYRNVYFNLTLKDFETLEIFENEVKVEDVPYIKFSDLNQDGKVDFVEITVPLLSKTINYTLLGKTSIESEFEREVKCNGCYDLTVPPSTLINISIYVSTFFEFERITENLPAEWKIVNVSENGIVRITNASYNQIEWKIKSTQAKVWYLVYSPSIEGIYHFQVEIASSNFSIVSEPWSLSVESKKECIQISSLPLYVESSDSCYKLERNLRTEGFGILINGRENVTIDCEGHKIVGGFFNFNGIFVINSKDVTIKNCEIRGFQIGIILENSSSNQIVGNSLTRNLNGIVLHNSHKNLLKNNIALTNTYYGILLLSSFNNSLQDNQVKSTSNPKFLTRFK